MIAIIEFTPSKSHNFALRPRHAPVAVRRFEVVGTLERATNALLWRNDTEVDLGGRHKSKILWLSHRLVVAPEVAGHRPQAVVGTCRALVHCLVQVAVGAESIRALGSAGRELGEPRLRLEEVDGGSETRSLGRSWAVGGLGRGAASGKPIGERCRADQTATPDLLAASLFIASSLFLGFADITEAPHPPPFE